MRRSSPHDVEAAVALDRLLPGREDVAADLLERRAAAALGRLVLRRHGVDVVGADGQRDLRELRAVERPVHLDRRHVVDDQARERDVLHVVVAGGRRGRVDAARQRRERADDGDRALQRGDRLEQRQRIGRRQLAAP